MKTLHSAIPKAINSGATDAELDLVIESYLSDNNINKTVTQWRTENYSQLRHWAYPTVFEYLDAQVKIKGVERATEGKNQEDKYVQECLNVKTRFKKER